MKLYVKEYCFLSLYFEYLHHSKQEVSLTVDCCYIFSCLQEGTRNESSVPQRLVKFKGKSFESTLLSHLNLLLVCVYVWETRIRLTLLLCLLFPDHKVWFSVAIFIMIWFQNVKQIVFCYVQGSLGKLEVNERKKCRIFILQFLKYQLIVLD